MAFVAVATSVGAAVLGTGAAAGIGSAIVGGVILGAGAGGLYSAITGDGDILNSMLTGGLIGGAGAGIGSAAMGASTTAGGGATGLGATGSAATTVNTVTPAMAAAGGGGSAGVGGLTASSVPSLTGGLGLTSGTAAGGAAAGTAAGGAAAGGAGLTAASVPTLTSGLGVGSGGALGAGAGAVGAGTGAGTTAAALTGKEVLGYGLAGTAAMQLLGSKPSSANAPTDPGMVRPYTFSSNPTPATGRFPSPYATAQYDAAGMPIMDTRERNYFDQKYTAQTPYSAKTGTVNPNTPVDAANGGLMAIGGPVERMSQNVMGGQGNMFPQSQQDITQFATPSQMPASAEIIRSDYDTKTNPYTGVMMAGGGKAEEDDGETYKEKMKRLKSANSMLKEIEETGRVSMPDFGDYMPEIYAPRSEPSRLSLNAMPQATIESPQMKGIMGRAGANYAIDRDTNVMAGLSGFAGRDRGAATVRPETMDIGVSRRVGPGFLTGQYERSLTGRGEPRYMANYAIPMSQGGVTYDPATQTYAGNGISQAPAAPAQSLPPLAADLVASLTPQWQAANPYKFAYDPKAQKYSAATPDMNQLNAFKTEQDRVAAEAAAAAAAAAEGQGYQSYAMGGGVQGYNLGGYSDGGRLLRGPGDGVSDDIPATIGGKQPARLADGEFVIPARIVSELGNGSTDAGAKRLYAMMDRIQAGRKKTIGKKNVAKDTKAKKHLLA